MTVEQAQKKLNLGSGDRQKEGYLNIDWCADSNPDVVHDLNVFPYPFAANSFEEIDASHVLEHLDRPFLVMKELHRILKPGGLLHVWVPHFSRGFTHAEHAHGFDVTFPLYFNKGNKVSGNYGCEYELQKLELHWMAFFHLMPYMGYGKITIGVLRLLNTVISGLARLSPAFCSRVWCFWVGGFEEIEFVFSCRK
jgi:SAM-dependent methyltransferase